MTKVANAPLGSFGVEDVILPGQKALQAVNAAPMLKILTDEVGPTYNYYGWAQLGTQSSASAWRIMRLTNGTLGAVEFADGNTNFDNIWDNRASLSYS
jgi:hypothetical protein